MTIEEALIVIEKTLPPSSLNSLTLLVFKESWEGKTYGDISEKTGYGGDYVRAVAAKLWKSLSEALGKKTTKKNFKVLLLDRYRQLKSEGIVVSQEAKAELERGIWEPARCDWGTAPDVSDFYGREAELGKLEQYIIGDRCRLVALLGLGGIGKTTLSVKIAELLEGQFDFIIWRALRNAPTLEETISDFLAILSVTTAGDLDNGQEINGEINGQETNGQINGQEINEREIKGSLGELLFYLRQSRCLIVLDNLETILEPGQTGRYREGYDNYGNLLRAVASSSHSSCLMLTSREKLPEVAAFEEVEGAARALYLPGSPEAARAILQAKKIGGTDAEIEQLCQYCSNNPLALKIIATSISELFEGNVGQFLALETFAFNGIRAVLDQQFDRLSDLEKDIMVWLAIARDWTRITQLEKDIVPRVARFKLLEAMESLIWRSLVEKKAGRYSLQPVVMEYVTDNLIGDVFPELTGRQTGGQLKSLNRYALAKTNVVDYIRASQARLILEPLGRLLAGAFRSEEAIAQHLQALLQQLGAESKSGFSASFPGYAAGNIINLGISLNLDMNGWDFSELIIRHADLSEVKLHNANFAGAEFKESYFAESMGGIFQVAYSPDGKLLATGDSKGNIRVLGGKDLTAIATFSNPDWVWSIAFSRDSKQIASGGADGAVRIWDLESGECRYSLPVETELVQSLAFAADSQQLAIGCAGSDRIYFWQPSRGRVISKSEYAEETLNVQIMADGKHFATIGDDGKFKFWKAENSENWQCLQSFIGHQNVVTAVAASPDGETLLSGSNDGAVKLWDIETGKCLQTYLGHTGAIESVRVSPDGELLASSAGKTIRLWDISGKCLKILQGHSDTVGSLAFSPDGETLASGSHDQTAILWQMPGGDRIKTLRGYVNYISSLDWQPELGCRVSGVGRGEREEGSGVWELEAKPLLVSGGTDSMVRIWQPLTGECLQTLRGHKGWVSSVAWSPNGKTIASGSVDRAIRLWNADSGQCEKILAAHADWIVWVAWSPDGKALASSSADGSIKLWNLGSGECFQTLEEHQYLVFAVVWSPNGQFLASGSIDCTVRIWNAANGECLKVFQLEKTWVWRLAWSPDSSILAFGLDDFSIGLWDTSDYTQVGSLLGHNATISSVAFSPTGKTIASASLDLEIRLWDANSGQCLHILQGHTELIYATAFSPDGELLATGSEDGTIRIWQVTTGECLSLAIAPKPYEGTNIAGVKGLTKAQLDSLKTLGAVEKV